MDEWKLKFNMASLNPEFMGATRNDMQDDVNKICIGRLISQVKV